MELKSIAVSYQSFKSPEQPWFPRDSDLGFHSCQRFARTGGIFVFAFRLGPRISKHSDLRNQSQDPSFHPSLHLSSTREQSNWGLPSRTLMSLWRRQSHWERAWRLLASGWLVFNLQTGEGVSGKWLTSYLITVYLKCDSTDIQMQLILLLVQKHQR